MPILRMTFTSDEMQHVAGMNLDGIVIHTTPTRNVMGACSAPPNPPNRVHSVVFMVAVALAAVALAAAAAGVALAVAVTTAVAEAVSVAVAASAATEDRATNAKLPLRASECYPV